MKVFYISNRQFEVESQMDPHKRYIVTLPPLAQLWHEEATCTCAQFRHEPQKRPCKHIVAVAQRIAERTPTRIFVAGLGEYAREAHEIAFCACERHTHAWIAALDAISRPDVRPLTPPPPHNAVVLAAIVAAASQSPHRVWLKRGNIYDARGACVAVDVDPALVRGLNEVFECEQKNASSIVVRFALA